MNNFFKLYCNMSNNMSNNKVKKEWKWSTGDLYSRSARVKKETEEQYKEEEYEKRKEESELFNVLSQETAYQQAFLNDHWNFERQSIQGFQELNKREDTYNRMSEREIVGQIGMNPFMENKSYVDDIIVQDNYLRSSTT